MGRGGMKEGMKTSVVELDKKGSNLALFAEDGGWEKAVWRRYFCTCAKHPFGNVFSMYCVYFVGFWEQDFHKLCRDSIPTVNLSFIIYK